MGGDGSALPPSDPGMCKGKYAILMHATIGIIRFKSVHALCAFAKSVFGWRVVCVGYVS